MNIARHAVVFASLLAACPAATAQVEVAPPPHATLDDVVKEYLRLKLPLPPKDAVLARREYWFPKHLMCVNGVPEEERGRNKLVCEFGFVNPSGAPRFFRGPGWDYPEDIDRSQLKNPDSPQPVHAEPWHIDEGSVAMAVVCKLRGWHERASEFHARAVGSNLAREDGVTLLQNLRRIAFRIAEAKLTERTSDRAAVFARPTRLYGENADLRTDANRILLARLGATVHFQRVAKPGSIHAWIDDLTDYWEDPESKSEAGQEAYWKLVESGFDAVPELIKHAGDTRLTRSGSFIAGYVTVGHLCSRILFELSGRSIAGYTHKEGGFLEAKLAEDWFAEARKVGEKKWLLANVDAGIPPGESAYHIPTPHVARAIAIKYPASLPAIYRGALRNKPDERLKDFVNEVLISRLEQQAKVSLLEEVAASDRMEHRAYALAGLAKLDAPTFHKHLRATLLKLIADKGRGWDTLVYNLPPLLHSVADRECWLLFATLAKSMSPYDRIMLIHHTDEPADKPEPTAIRRLRIEFHLGFLHDDASDRVGRQGDVRDTAAYQMRTLFKIPRRPAEEFEIDNGPVSRFLLRALVLEKSRKELGRHNQPD
jgi:hypothetical protein